MAINFTLFSGYQASFYLKIINQSSILYDQFAYFTILTLLQLLLIIPDIQETVTAAYSIVGMLLSAAEAIVNIENFGPKAKKEETQKMPSVDAA